MSATNGTDGRYYAHMTPPGIVKEQGDLIRLFSDRETGFEGNSGTGFRCK
jgi:hypothetical protein